MSSIRPRGNRWYYYYYYRGKKKERSMGIECRDRKGNTINHRLARKLQAEWDYERRQPGWHTDRWKSDPEPVVTLREFIEEDLNYLNSQKNRYKPTTLAHYHTSYLHLQRCFPENILLLDISRKVIEKEFMPYLYNNYQWNTARGILIDLRAAFNRAMRWEYIENNPFAGVNTRRKKTLPKFYTEAEIEIMREYFDRPDIPKWQGDIVFLCLNTGLRREEAVLLDWNRHVHLDIGALVFPGKGDKERAIPLNSDSLNILHSRPRSRDRKKTRVFWEIKNHEGFKSAFDRMKERTGLGGNIHQLRKTFASYWAMNGGNPYKLMDILGHESLSTVLIYYALSPESLHSSKEDFPSFQRHPTNTPPFSTSQAKKGGDGRKS